MYFQGLVEEGDTAVSGLSVFGTRTGNEEQFHKGLNRAGILESGLLFFC